MRRRPMALTAAFVQITPTTTHFKVFFVTDAGIDGVRIERRPLQAVPSRQRLYIYRDVPGSNQIGIQAAWQSAMLGLQSLTGGEYVRQYDAGMPDGSGTFVLTPVWPAPVRPPAVSSVIGG
jgi:hypothetical protein